MGNEENKYNEFKEQFREYIKENVETISRIRLVVTIFAMWFWLTHLPITVISTFAALGIYYGVFVIIVYIMAIGFLFKKFMEKEDNE